ncbi:MAG: PspA/IM30 family protein [Candidatus Methylumidiphilus sp.]
MPESIATRVARIIAGGTYALLDKAETLAPDTVMAQAIREIEQVASEVRVDLGKAEAAKHLVSHQMAKLNEEHAKLTGQIATAVGEHRDDLATAAIGRQTDIEDFLPVLQKSLDEQNDKAEDLVGYIMALLAKKRELEQILIEYQAHKLARPEMERGNGDSDRQSRVEDAEAAFGRVLAKQLGMSGLGMGVTEDAAKIKELAELQRGKRIAERLAAVKAATPRVD